jgi:hypothetical protein
MSFRYLWSWYCLRGPAPTILDQLPAAMFDPLIDVSDDDESDDNDMLGVDADWIDARASQLGHVNTFRFATPQLGGSSSSSSSSRARNPNQAIC